MTKIFYEKEKSNFQSWLEASNYNQFILLSDANTNGFCIPILKKICPIFKNAHHIIIPQSEVNKTVQTSELIWSKLNQINAHKKSLLVNVGGGVVSDIGGFCAATYKRGIDFINIPTTLLAQVDACYGGKTGVDFNGFKNNIGVFSHPQAIFISATFLKTLNQKVVRSGIAEMIKHTLIYSKERWNTLQKMEEVQFYENDLVKESLQVKIHIVSQDEHDENIRQSLNFGHSIGHAIESYFLSKNEPMIHGEAVMLGMKHELALSEAVLGLSAEIRSEFEALEQKLFPDLNTNYAFENLVPFLFHDKKNIGGIRMSLLKNVGDCHVQQVVSLEQIKHCLES